MANDPVSGYRQRLWDAGKHPIVYRLYTANPFYLLSAVLTLVGLHLQFAPRNVDLNSITYDSWLLLELLGGYILLLAVTGFLVGRFGVWEDARTILLTIVLLFVATSASFDHLLLNDPAVGRKLLFAGLAMSLLISEALLWGLRIRLPVLFRIPFHLGLGLFFLYPALLVYLLDEIGGNDPQWGFETTIAGILLFPATGAAIALTLLPAVWQGPKYTADNGTPWGWPWYPWSLFFFLAVGVILRSYYLTYSFYPNVSTASGFSVYFLTPFLLAIAVIVFEAGRSVGNRPAQGVALVVPLCLLWFALPGWGESVSERDFLIVHVNWFGSPIQVAWGGLMILYAYALLRGVRAVVSPLGMLVALGSVLDSNTLDLGSLADPSLPLLAVSTVILLADAFYRWRSSLRWFLAVCSAVGTLTVAAWDTPFTLLDGAFPLHLLIAAGLLVGFVFEDGFAKFLRVVSLAAWLIPMSAAAMWEPLSPFAPTAGLFVYLLVAAGLQWFCWYRWRHGTLMFAIGGSALWITYVVRCLSALSSHLRDPRGVLLVAGGLVFFVLGLVISLIKAGKIRVRPSEENPLTPD